MRRQPPGVQIVPRQSATKRPPRISPRDSRRRNTNSMSRQAVTRFRGQQLAAEDAVSPEQLPGSEFGKVVRGGAFRFEQGPSSLACPTRGRRRWRDRSSRRASPVTRARGQRMNRGNQACCDQLPEASSTSDGRWCVPFTISAKNDAPRRLRNRGHFLQEQRGLTRLPEQDPVASPRFPAGRGQGPQFG